MLRAVRVWQHGSEMAYHVIIDNAAVFLWSRGVSLLTEKGMVLDLHGQQ